MAASASRPGTPTPACRFTCLFCARELAYARFSRAMSRDTRYPDRPDTPWEVFLSEIPRSENRRIVCNSRRWDVVFVIFWGFLGLTTFEGNTVGLPLDCTKLEYLWICPLWILQWYIKYIYYSFDTVIRRYWILGWRNYGWEIKISQLLRFLELLVWQRWGKVMLHLLLNSINSKYFMNFSTYIKCLKIFTTRYQILD